MANECGSVFPFGGNQQVVPSDVLPSLFQNHVQVKMAPDAVALRDLPPTWYRRPGGVDDARLREYRLGKAVMDITKHRELFTRIRCGADPPPERYWIPVDMGGMLARLMRHYVFGRDFRLQATVSGGEDTLRQLVSGMQMVTQFREGSEEGVAFGDIVYKVDVEDREGADGQTRPVPILKYVPPWHYFPELDPMDAEHVLSVTFAWVTSKPPDVSGNGDWVVIREIHEPGTTSWALNVWDGEELGERLSHNMLRDMVRDPNLPETEETGINEIPVVHVGYAAEAGHHFGRSEFPRVVSIITALENRLAQEDEVLQKHARPKLVVGPGMLDEDGGFALAEHFDVIEVDPGLMEKAIKPEYLTWDMQIQGIEHEIEKLEEYFFMTTETSPASFGLERDGSQVESARALKFKAHRTVNKVNDFRDEWTPAIQNIVRISQKRWNAALTEDNLPTVLRTGVRIVWGDAIIEDDSQEVLDYTALKGTGLVSRKRAVADIFNLTEEEADAEVAEILQDEVDETAATTVSSRAPVAAVGAAEELSEEAQAATQAPAGAPPEDVEPDAEV